MFDIRSRFNASPPQTQTWRLKRVEQATVQHRFARCRMKARPFAARLCDAATKPQQIVINGLARRSQRHRLIPDKQR